MGALIRRPTLLVISQTYRPDPAAVGQYIADAAEEMARRGWRVRVLTANRGFDDPGVKYPASEVIDGVEVRRLPFSSLGKSSIAVRMVGGMLFVAQAACRALCMQRIDALLISTSPPVSPLAGLLLRAARRTPMLYWVMDLNPDQYVALGRASPTAAVVRAFDWMNRLILRAATRVVVLDRFMADRVNAKVDVRHKLSVIPPWSRDSRLAPVHHAQNAFRARHGLEGKFVVMYSGNHSPANPISTLVEAARRLKDDDRLAFVFIGGGSSKGEVDAAVAECPNILSLPYQPMETLSESLSAADVHVATMGDGLVGIVHPSKVYAAFAVQRPVLFIGPERSHVGDMLGAAELGWHASQGDLDTAAATIAELAGSRDGRVEAAGRVARQVAVSRFGAARLCGQLCDLIEHMDT